MAYNASAAAVLLLLAAAVIGCHAHVRAAGLHEKAAAGGGGHGGCRLSDIKVSQERTGKVVQGQPEYRVTIRNQCRCAQSYVMVRCNRLPTVEPVDSTQIKVLDELCMVATTLFQGSSVTFTYAWKAPQDFAVVSAKVQC